MTVAARLTIHVHARTAAFRAFVKTINFYLFGRMSSANYMEMMVYTKALSTALFFKVEVLHLLNYQSF